MTFGPWRHSTDVVEGASGHAMPPAAVAFRPADCLGLAREDCGVYAKFASKARGAISHHDRSGHHPSDLSSDAASRHGMTVDR